MKTVGGVFIWLREQRADCGEGRGTNELNSSARAETQDLTVVRQKPWKQGWASLQVCNGDLG